MAKQVKFNQAGNPWASINLKTPRQKKAGTGKAKPRKGKGGTFGS